MEPRGWHAGRGTARPARGVPGRARPTARAGRGARRRAAAARRPASCSCPLGLVLVLIGYIGASGTTELQRPGALPPLRRDPRPGLTVVGAALFLRYSLGRYLRFWLLRLIYEEHTTADRQVDALERLGEQIAPGFDRRRRPDREDHDDARRAVAAALVAPPCWPRAAATATTPATRPADDTTTTDGGHDDDGRSGRRRGGRAPC